jgi:hypothetical protein
MNETELESIDPDEKAAMQKDRFIYRYPQGEVSQIGSHIR